MPRGEYCGPTPEDDLKRMEEEQASVERVTGRPSGYNIRHEKAFMATVATRDPYDPVPDGYNYTTAYGRTADEAMQRAVSRAYARED